MLLALIVAFNFALLNLPTCANCKFNNLFCEERIFYKPYVRVYAAPEGDVVLEQTTGFLDINASRASYMCLNGPTLVYFGVKPKRDEQLYFGAYFEVFVHFCLYINMNRLNTRKSAPRMPKAQRSLISKTTSSFCNNTVHTRVGFSHDSVFSGKKVWGINLLGDSQDYRRHRVVLFYEKEYGVRMYKSGNTTIHKTEAFGLSIVSVGGASSIYASQDCLSLHGSPAQALVFPNKTDKIDLQGSPENHICLREQTENDTDWVNIKNSSHVFLSEARKHSCNSTAPIVFQHCTKIPSYKDECKARRPDADFSCEVLGLIMGEYIPKFPQQVVWQLQGFELFQKIFNKGCPWVPAYYTAEVGKLIEYYVQEAHKSGNVKFSQIKSQVPSWPFLISSLQHCLDNIEAMTFNGVKFVSRDQFKRDIRFNNNTGRSFKAVPLVFFTEEADEAFEFNRIFEMQWIMFATVLGICPKYYLNETASISSRLYTYFSEGFLIPFSSAWVNPEHNKILELLLPQYVNDKIHLQAMSCLEASFVQSNTVGYRFSRPLITYCQE